MAAAVASAPTVFRILPKALASSYSDAAHGPLFFLAGPLGGGGDWQSDMCAALLQCVPTGFTAVLPYGLEDRPATDPSHAAFPLTALPAEAFTARQLPWERAYLDAAAGAQPPPGSSTPCRGCLVFWLPQESASHPKGPGHGPYAQDTRGELGEWRGRLMSNRSLRVVVGGEEGFRGFDTVRRNFKLALGDDFPVHDTRGEGGEPKRTPRECMLATAAAAAKLALATGSSAAGSAGSEASAAGGSSA